MIKNYEVKLTLQELLILDGQVSENAQKIIESAKKESSYGFKLPVMNEVLKKSEEIGKLSWTYKNIRDCEYCGKKRDYYTYSRSSRNHRKGEKDYNNPMYYSGIAFNEGFVTVRGCGDMCVECLKNHKVIEQLVDYILDNDLKIEIQKNSYKPTRYIKDEIRVCWKCNKEMQESKMGKRPTIMGGGTYPSACPNCKAESSMFGNSHKCTDKFVMLKVT